MAQSLLRKPGFDPQCIQHSRSSQNCLAQLTPFFNVCSVVSISDFAFSVRALNCHHHILELALNYFCFAIDMTLPCHLLKTLISARLDAQKRFMPGIRFFKLFQLVLKTCAFVNNETPLAFLKLCSSLRTPFLGCVAFFFICCCTA